MYNIQYYILLILFDNFNNHPSNNSIEGFIFIFVPPVKVFIVPLSGEIVFGNECRNRISLDSISVDLVVFRTEERRKIIVW